MKLSRAAGADVLVSETMAHLRSHGTMKFLKLVRQFLARSTP
ncbi:MAG TPA: hypothetical protein VGM27_10825 [Acidobacteriaceae bacterium]